MNKEKFIQAMIQRFRLNVPGKAEIRPDRLSYKVDYEEFADKNGHILDKVFQAVKDTWADNWAPNKASLNNIAKNIYTEIEYEKKQREIAMVRTGIVECLDCGVRRSIKSAVCPDCYSRRQVRIFSEQPIEHKKLQADCYRCSYYKVSPPAEKRLYGPVCVYYGRLEAGLEAGKASGKEPCEICACRECCRMEWKFKTDPAGYKAEYGNKDNPVYQPGTYNPVWIDTNVPVLGNNS